MQDRRIQTAAVEPGQQVRFGAVDVLLSLGPDGHGELDSEIETVEPRRIGNATSGLPSAQNGLSPAQLRVLALLLEGLLEKQVAKKLGISQNTVHNHVREIYRTYRVHSRAELLLQTLPHRK